MFPFPSSRICFCVYILCFLNLYSADKLDVTSWKCMDEKCSAPISTGKVRKNYEAPDDVNKVPVRVGQKVDILRIPAEPPIKYLYVKTKDQKEGLVRKDYIWEDKDISELQLKTVTLAKESSQNKTPDIRPSATNTVIDGTTLPPHEDPPYQYAPTQAQEHMSEGTSSVFQSTTQTSVGNQPSSSENSSESNSQNASEPQTSVSSQPSASVNSSELKSQNVSEGDKESEDASYAPTQVQGQMNDTETHSAVQSATQTQTSVSNQPLANMNSSESKSQTASEGEQVLEGASYAPTQVQGQTNVPETRLIFQSTTPPSDIDQQSSSENSSEFKSQNVSEGEQESKDSNSQPISSVDHHASSVTAKLTSNDTDANSTTSKHVTATPTYDDTYANNLTGKQTVNHQDYSAPPTPVESSTPFNSSSEQIKADALVKKKVSESDQTDSVDENVSNLDSVLEKKSSDPGVEQSKENYGSSAELSENTESDTIGHSTISSDLVDHDHDSEPSQNVPIEKRNSSQAGSEPGGQQTLDTQFINEDSLTKYEKLVSNSSSPSDTESGGAPEPSHSRTDSEDNLERTRNVTNPTEDSTSAKSNKSDPTITIQEHAGSQNNFEEPTPPNSARANAVMESPHISVQGLYPTTPTVEFHEVVSGPTTVPATQTSELNEPEPSAISVVKAEVLETTFEEPSVQEQPSAISEQPSELPVPEPPAISAVNAKVLETTFEEPSVQEQSSNDWYSSIVSTFASLQEMFSSNEVKPDISPVVSAPEVTPKLQVDEQSETCTTDTCESQPQLPSGMEKDVSNLIYDNIWLSSGGMTLMIITAVAVLLFSLGYYYLENLKRDVELINKYNDLAGKLFIEQKEKEMMAEQLTSANESMSQMSFDTTKYDKEICDLKALVHKYKDEKNAIEEKEKETRKKFMMVDKNYNELRNILSQNKQKGERSALILDIKNLKESIAGNNIEIASLKEQLLEKKEEIKSLNARIMEFMEAKKQLEENVEKAISENHKTAQKYQDNIAKLERTIEESAVARAKLEKDCTQLKKENESLAIEKELAESSLQKYQRLKPSVALTEWLDAKEVRVSLLAAEKKIEEITKIRDELTREKTLLEEKERTLVVDFEQLNEKYEKGEKEKIEALTKLQVLSDYFKEKETQLQEELGTKESLWLQKQSDDRTIYEQMRALREENASFKNQNETLKREILDQEASFKKLITSAEEKAHENWVALRHQERRLKEAQMEAAQLRSRLTTLESAGDNSDDKISKGEVNGDMPPYGSATSPPFMLYPEFVPPPPLHQTTPSRPPPLGRISSPPLGDFTPPPPLVPYEMFLPPSPPPPASHVLHKPQPLDGSHRIQKDSQSSNHSSESAPDRTRRNKR